MSTLEQGRLKYFAFDVICPDEAYSRFLIAHDLAGLFGVDYNEQAVKLLRRALANTDARNRTGLSVDWESGCVFVTSAKPIPIYTAASCINGLCLPTYRRSVTPKIAADLESLLCGWVRPKPKRWKVGDLFCFKYADDLFGFGQVLGKRSISPTCGLFSLRTSHVPDDLSLITSSAMIAILHVGQDELAIGNWKILANLPPAAMPDSGPQGDGMSIGNRSFGGGSALEALANAYYGLVPWNTFYGDERFWEQFLMSNVKVPNWVLHLSPEELLKYKAQIKGNTK